MKRIVPFILAIVLLFSGCGSAGQQTGTSNSGKENTASKEIYIMAGKIESKDKADVNSKISARVSKLTVDVGSQVNKGDPVIYLDTKDIEAQVKQAEAGVATAQASLEKVLSGARPEQKAQAQATLDSAGKNYENAKNSYERIKQLYQQGAASQQQFEAAEGQYTSAQAQYKSAQEALDMLNKGETKETIDVSRAQVEQAQAALEVAKTQQSNGTITAPVSGIVSAKNINEGEMASPGVVLVSIVNNDGLYVNAYLPSSLVTRVKPGQPVVVKVSEVPEQRFDGEISVVNSVIDSKNKNVLVKVMLKDPNSVLKPGMFAEIGLKN